MSISKLYTSPAEPASFSGASTFGRNHKSLKLTDIKTALAKTDVYTLHKQVHRKFPRRKFQVNGIDDQWQVDLMDIKKQKYQNSHMTFILTCVDVFRRFGWAIPIKNKEAKSCREAFEKIFATSKPPKYIYSDAGNEFKGECRRLFKEHGITALATKSVHKAAIVERFNRTLREKISRFVTWNKQTNGSERFIDALPDLVKSYNATIHDAIGVSPDSVNKANEEQIRLKLYGPQDDLIRFVFKQGDYVRLVIDKKLFEKGATANWSEELYIVCQLCPTVPPTYKVKTLQDEELDWKYYAQELQKVAFNEFPIDTFKIVENQGDQILVVKLNSENQKEVLVDRSFLE